MLLSSAVFIIGYFFIALEHKIRIDKASVALFLGIILWLLLAFSKVELPETLLKLAEHFEEISEILFFLLGAMTIVELIDTHNGFSIFQNLIRSKKKIGLLWTLSILTFFLSAILDNLTTTIVMVAILKKFISKKEDLWYFAGFVIIAANAGGAWSPIGDVTTIMLWNGGQVSTNAILGDVFLPSLACIISPLLLAWFHFKNQKLEAYTVNSKVSAEIDSKESNLVLILGVVLLMSVPLFKFISHLPPYMGMLFSLSVFWLITEVLHRNKSNELKHHLSVASTVKRIDTPSILFFLGILLAVAALEANGSLFYMGNFLETTFHDFHISNTLLGLLSAVIDNVPLVAGAMGMYSIDVFPMDHEFWTFLAYCAGTGGSVLIIGSAAGVAAMGILKIDFLWFLKHMSWLALIGYFAGIATYLLFN